MVFPIQSAGSATVHTARPLRVATAGEALFDLIEEPDGRLKPCAGGAVYNLTRALALQGVGTLYLNPLSGDMQGRQLARGLHDAGVALASPRRCARPARWRWPRWMPRARPATASTATAWPTAR